MSSDQLFRNAAGEIVEGEPLFFRRDLGVKNDLQQKIAEFLAQIGIVARVDGGDDLVRFLEDIRAERPMRLFAIPWTSARPAQQGDDRAQCGERIT
jgi:hypothetical protein